MTKSKDIFLSAIGLFIVAALVIACEEPVKLDIGQTPTRIVIEGLITNQPGYQFIKVTRTADFYGSGKTPRVTNASVIVSDNAGNQITFVNNPRNHADSAGFYVPQTPFTGVIGRTYKMRVYEAQDEMFAVTKMDSLSYALDADEAEDPEVEGRAYEVLMFTKEPQNEINYYYFKFYRNDSLKYLNDTDIYYSDDEFLAQNINGVESPIFYAIGDKSRVEMYSITRAGYLYYADMWNLLNNDAGGMFGPIPATPRTNLSNGALGFFQVSALDVGEITIE
ncbi:MAG: DUF4249 domain-containing protein [Bacteroidota bacterium]